MKKIIKMRNIIGILALTMMTSAYGETGNYCNFKVVDKIGMCKEGDMILTREIDVLNKFKEVDLPLFAVKYCKVGTISMIKKDMVCEYIGYKRTVSGI